MFLCGNGPLLHISADKNTSQRNALAPLMLESESEEEAGAVGHLAYDGPHQQHPRGALVLLHTPLLVPSDASVRATKRGRAGRF